METQNYCETVKGIHTVPSTVLKHVFMEDRRNYKKYSSSNRITHRVRFDNHLPDIETTDFDPLIYHTTVWNAHPEDPAMETNCLFTQQFFI